MGYLPVGKVILPIWHNVTKENVSAYSSILANRLAISSSKGIDFILNQIRFAIDKEKSLKLPPKKENDKLSHLKGLAAKVKGINVVEEYKKNFVDSYKVNPSAISSLNLRLYEDYSGIDVYESSILMENGVSFFFQKQIFLAALKKSISLPNFEIAFWWIPELFAWKREKHELGNLDINVLLISEIPEQITPIIALELLNDLSKIPELVEEYPFPYDYIVDEAFEMKNLGKQMVKIVLDSDLFPEISILLFENFYPSRFKWKVAVACVELLEAKLLDFEKVNELLRKLLNENGPLNDYWREKIAKFSKTD